MSGCGSYKYEEGIYDVGGCIGIWGAKDCEDEDGTVEIIGVFGDCEDCKPGLILLILIL